MWYAPLEAALGLLLLFALPGFFTGRALFPEWRFTGPEGLTRVVETAALAVVLSTAYTVLLGAVLLNSNGTGFSATWSDPVLEGLLAGVALLAAVAAIARGGFARYPPPAPPLEAAGGDGGGWEGLRQAEALARQERRLRHALRTSQDSAETKRIAEELERLGRERESLRNAREAEYAL